MDSIKPEEQVSLPENRNSGKGKRENIFVNLIFNLIIPILILTRSATLESWLNLDPKIILIIALAFPVTYGLKDFIGQKKVNLFSCLGFLSILLKGSIGVFELDLRWVAVNEALLPLIFAIAFILPRKSRNPLLKEFLLNEHVFQVDLIESSLEKKGNLPAFDQLLRKCNIWMAGSFFLSSFLNFVVAKIFVKTDPAIDISSFNREIGAMQGWSYLIITVPCMIVMVYVLYLLVNGIHKLTGLTLEEVMQNPSRDKT